jgi:2-aminoadipate transaminase
MKKSDLSDLAQRTPEPPVSWLMASALANPQLISLAAGFTDHATLPLAETTDLFRELLRRPRIGRAALQYGTTAGDPELRHLTSRRLHALDTAAAGTPPPSGVCDPERMVITSGSQQLLYMLSECLCNPGDLVLVEDPTYFVFLGIVQSHGLQCRGVRMQADGLDLDHLEAQLESLRRSGQLRRLRLLYLVSYYQNPTGITTRLQKKRHALALLQRFERHAGHPLFLVEDAAYRELRFHGADVPSSLTLPGAARRVIYAGTFSKPFATGVRVGFGLLPDGLRQAVLRVKANHDFGTSNLLQQLLRQALATGHYEHHLQALRPRYAAKARHMANALQRHLPHDVAWVPADGGLYVWVTLPPSMPTGRTSAFFQHALAHNVLYVPGELCYACDPARPKPNHAMRLSFGGATPRAIRLGIQRLGDTYQELSP